MTLTYDQRSELRWAFEEAFVEPDRRRSCRVKHKIPAKLAPWSGTKGRSGAPLDVTIEDFSTTGVGLTHIAPLKENDRFLLEVPRADRKPIWLVLRVARCLPMDDGKYGVGLEMCEILEEDPLPASRTMKKRMKYWFLLFGIVGTAVSALI